MTQQEQQQPEATEAFTASELQEVINEEKTAAEKTPKTLKLQSLPTRTYLAQTVVPMYSSIWTLYTGQIKTS